MQILYLRWLIIIHLFLKINNKKNKSKKKEKKNHKKEKY